jgi:AAA15 family ATPase/GTPase
MAEEIKICKLIIKGYDQFRDIELDFTDPKTGEPLEKICFIGRNGTGKSKLLRVINLLMRGAGPANIFVAIKVKVANSVFYFLQHPDHYPNTRFSGIFREKIENHEEWTKGIFTNIKELRAKYEILLNEDDPLSQDAANFVDKGGWRNFLLIYCPPEDKSNPLVSLEDVPKTSLGEALYVENYFYYNKVSPSTVYQFWERLMYLIEMRRRENDNFEQNNLDKTKRQLIEEFDRDNPKILEKIAVVWNQILAKAGLEFDIENAKIPLQLNENLQAYLRLKNSKERINYNALSTGIRNFIFKLGHIYSLYYDREVTSGVLLLDEPENSLYPDFLFDLIDYYVQATKDKRSINNTQIFVATHNPIIAAQFKPEERIILEFDDEGAVTARRGITPEGDDPNDILQKDFAVRSLLGKKGIEKWERYLELKDKLRTSPKDEKSDEWRSELLSIGAEYNF